MQQLAVDYFPAIIKEIWESNEPETRPFLSGFWKICTHQSTTLYAKPYYDVGSIIGLEFYFVDNHDNSLRDVFGGIYPAKSLRSKRCTFEEFLDNHNVCKVEYCLYAH